MLLGLTPKDYDVATDAPPDRVRQLFKSTQAVGAAFGVILVRHGKSVIEVATFRTDLKYKDGRRPEGVVFTTAEEDAKRRDFTINGLFLDPLDGDKVIDFVGGQADLKSHVLRAIGEPNHRFEEDHLRLLRAVRFAARFALNIEPATADAIVRHAEHLKRISPERIAEELRLMLTAPAPARLRARDLLRRFGLERVILRFLPEVTDAPPGIFEAITEPSISFGLALSAIVLDAHGGKPLTPADQRKASAALRQALKISNDENDRMQGSLAFGHLLEGSPSVAAMKRFLAAPTSGEARLLMAALSPWHPMDQLLERLRELEKTEVAPPPLITGDDLTAAGLTPGPAFKRVLDAVYDAQLEDRITTKEQAMALALELSKHHPS
jgi:poly(A) polymerase